MMKLSQFLALLSALIVLASVVPLANTAAAASAAKLLQRKERSYDDYDYFDDYQDFHHDHRSSHGNGADLRRQQPDASFLNSQQQQQLLRQQQLEQQQLLQQQQLQQQQLLQQQQSQLQRPNRNNFNNNGPVFASTGTPSPNFNRPNPAPTTGPVVFINNTPTIATLPAFRRLPSPPPSFIACFGACQTTPEYNPICASNMQLYFNEQKFICARNCGLDIEIVRRGSCQGLFPMMRG